MRTVPNDSDPSAVARAAENLDYEPTSTDQDHAASRTVARQATDKDDLSQLLAMLALPYEEDDIVALLPLIASPAPEAEPTAPDPIGDTDMPIVDAHLAVALSMYRNGGYTLEQIREATDMEPAELAGHLAPEDHVDQGPAPAVTTVIDVPVTARPLPRPKTTPAPAPVPVVGFTGDQGELLAWGEAHESSSIQALAQRTRSGLADLAQRRGSEQAAAQAATEVEQLEKQLAAAKARLRQAKTGRIPAPAPAAAPVAAPTPIRVATSAGLPREVLAQIRTWARANGYDVADRGLIPATVLQAWNNRDQQLAKAG